jgi:hypothetical protein
MADQGISDHVPEIAPVHDLERFIEGERGVVALSEEYIRCNDYLAFAEAQLDAGTADSETNGRKTLGLTLDEGTHLVCQLLGLPPQILDDSDECTVRCMVASTPYLRARWLFPLGESTSQVAAVDSVRVVYALLYLYTVVKAARYAGMTRVTFQTVSKLHHDFGALLLMLTDVGRVMIWRPGVMIDARGFESSELRLRFWRIAKALLPSQQRRRATTLGNILLDALPREPAARVVFLKTAAVKLLGAIVPRDEEHRIASTRGRWQSEVQRWTLAHVDPSLVHAAYERSQSVSNGPSI